MEAEILRLCDLDFDRKQLKVVQGKGKKTTFATSEHFDLGIKKVYRREKPKIISFGELRGRGWWQVLIPDIRNGAFSGR